MKSRSEYFHHRRRRLRSRHLCTRCGSEIAKDNSSLCAGCLVIMAQKRSGLTSEVELKTKQAKTRRLLHRLDLIDEARRAVQEELDRT